MTVDGVDQGFSERWQPFICLQCSGSFLVLPHKEKSRQSQGSNSPLPDTNLRTEQTPLYRHLQVKTKNHYQLHFV